MSAITSYNMTGNAYIDGVLGNFKWASNNISYSFPANGSYYGTNYANAENVTNFGTLSGVQQTMAREALRIYSTVANLTFTQLDETMSQHADLRYGQSDRTPSAWAYEPSTRGEGGDVWFNRSTGYFVDPVKGKYAYHVFLHETGHAIGLDHPHEATSCRRPGLDRIYGHDLPLLHRWLRRLPATPTRTGALPSL